MFKTFPLSRIKYSHLPFNGNITPFRKIFHFNVCAETGVAGSYHIHFIGYEPSTSEISKCSGVIYYFRSCTIEFHFNLLMTVQRIYSGCQIYQEYLWYWKDIISKKHKLDLNHKISNNIHIYVYKIYKITLNSNECQTV